MVTNTRNGHSPPAENVPPHSLEAEHGLLGCILRDNQVVDEIAIMLRPEYLYRDAHQKIYAAMLDLWDRDKPIDLVTLAEELKKRQQIDDAGGYKYLAELWDGHPTAAHYRQYAELIRSKATARTLTHIGIDIAREAYHPGAEPGECVAKAERLINQLAESWTVGEPETLQDAMCRTWERIDARCENRSGSQGIPTGYHGLDEKLGGGLHPGEVVIIAARPSIGKTSLGCNIVRHLASQDNPALFISLEQSKEDIAERLMVAEAQVNSWKVRTGKLNSDECRSLMEASDRLPKRWLHIDATASQSALAIASKARRWKRRYGIRVLVVDYLQLIEPDNHRSPRHEQIGSISRRLKCLALDLQLAVVVMSQLNRSAEEDKDHEPKLYQLRDSGNLEQDADAVILLHRPEFYDAMVRPGEVDAIVAKNRNGPTGRVMLTYAKDHMRFYDFQPNQGSPFQE